MKEPILDCYRGDVKLKEWECVQVGHHKNVGKTIEEWQKNGWRLHAYQATGPYMGEINHYLLFERGEWACMHGKQQSGKCAEAYVDGKSTIEGSQKAMKESMVASETWELKT